MNAQETFNLLLEMDADERRHAIKEMTSDQREAIIDMMGLPKRCSQKKLCSEIEETQRFIRIARSTPHRS